jgi:hypothetical protein
MKSHFKSKSVRAAFTGFTATVMLVASALPALLGAQTVFASQVTSRSITMSHSAPGSASTYTISWNPASTTSIQGIVVDFCSNSPVVGNSTCTAPTGFSVGTPTATTSGGLGTSGWTAAAANSGRTLELTDSTAVTQSTSTADTISLSTATNPTTACSSASACEFYARIITYSSTTGATSYVPGTEGSYVDDGGVALSTASTINLSATVQESINFCVYTSSCGTTPVNVVLGHTIGSTTVIDSSAVDTQNVNYSLSSNASHGVSVSVLGSTLTDAASQTIPALISPGTITAGTADFGLCLSLPSSSMTVASPYTNVSGGCTSSSTYVYTATASSATPIATTSAPINGYVGTLTYAVTASNTTPTGIYTATHQLIATGTF